MALTNCKECKKEVSTEAKTCPYCGIDNPGVCDPGVIDHLNRRVGIVVLALLIFLCLYVFTKHERVGYQYTENAGISENKGVGLAKVAQGTNPTQSSSEQIKPKDAPANEASTPSQQSSLQKTPQPPASQELPKQAVQELDKTRNISSSDIPHIMVRQMLEYALKEGGLSHESEIQQTKLKIESSPKPAKGNKKAAKAINFKALAAFKKGDFNNAVKMFEAAYKLDKSDSEIINNLGFSYLKQGNLNSAQQAITIALTLSPGRATTWENLGEVIGERGDVSKAVACFSNAYRFSKNRLKLIL